MLHSGFPGKRAQLRCRVLLFFQDLSYLKSGAFGEFCYKIYHDNEFWISSLLMMVKASVECTVALVYWDWTNQNAPICWAGLCCCSWKYIFAAFIASPTVLWVCLISKCKSPSFAFAQSFIWPIENVSVLFRTSYFFPRWIIAKN